MEQLNRSSQSTASKNPPGRLRNSIGNGLILLCVIVLVGWVLDAEQLVRISQHFPSMKANTAVCFGLLGIALKASHQQSREILYPCTFTVLFISGVTAGEWLLDIELGIDQLLINDHLSLSFPGRMSMATAITFITASIAIIISDSFKENDSLLYDLILLAAAAIPIAALCIYFYSPKSLIQIDFFSTMAIHTSLSFIAYFVAILADNHSRIWRLLSSETKGAITFRALVLPIIAFPLALGALINNIIISADIDAAWTLALFIAAYIPVALATLVFIARSLDQIYMLENNWHETRHLMAAVLENNSDALVLFDQNGRVKAHNSEAISKFGWDSTQFLQKTLRNLIPEDDINRHKKALLDVINGDSGHTAHFDTLNIHGVTSKGDEFPIVLTLKKTVINQIDFILATIRDASEIEIKMSELDKKAHIDFLTQMGNRISLNEHLALLDTHLHQRRSTLGVMMIDIDRLKQINDTHGHDVGDEVLKLFSTTVRNTLRQHDLIFRYGGDEFVGILENIDHQLLKQTCQRIINALKELEIPQKRGTVHVSCSIGGSVLTPQDTSIQSVVKRADDALYAAKSSGRNQCIIYGSPETQ